MRISDWSSDVCSSDLSVNYPGEFGGGVVNLTTTTLPEESFLQIKGSVSGDTETTGRLGYTYYGSDTDWTGFDDGTRDIPFPLRKAISSGRAISLDTLSPDAPFDARSEEHTSELQSLMRISYAVL